MKSIEMVHRDARVTLVNDIGGTVVIDVASALRGIDLEEDIITQLNRISGQIKLYANGELVVGDLWLVMTKGTISNADTAKDGSPGTDISKTLDEMCSDEYSFQKLGIFKPIGAGVGNYSYSHLTHFNYKPSKKLRKAFVSDESKDTNINIAIVMRVLASGVLGAHEFLTTYSLEYTNRKRNPADIFN